MSLPRTSPTPPAPTLPVPDLTLRLADGPEPVWQGAWPDRIANRIGRPELHLYRAPAGAHGRRPRAQALVCAGGGYLALVHDKEGVQIAQWLNTLGLDAWVLLHRLPGQDDGAGGVWPADIALADGLRALDAIDQAAPGVPLLLVGLSSGGHLAGTLACQPRPQSATPALGALIAYAPINANHREHKAPAGKPDYPPPEKQAFYDAWPVGIASAPHGLPRMPVFLAYALHDTVVPVDHALNLLRSAAQCGLEVDAHIFAQAPHGFALRSLDGHHAQWPALAADWIDRRLAAAPRQAA